MLPQDPTVVLTLDPRDATCEIVVDVPAVHLTIRVENGKKKPFLVKAGRFSALALEYKDANDQPHLHRSSQENPSSAAAILWAPKGMRVVIKAAAAFYVAPEHRVSLFIEDKR